MTPEKRNHEMKITKSQLKQIIKEEIEDVNSIDEGLENITPENIEILMKAVQHFATQPAVTAALATGGLVAAVAKIKDLVQSGE
jgi:rRNA maturation endonuclease Nob1